MIIEIVISLLAILILVGLFIIYQKIIQNNKSQQIIMQYEDWIENFALTVDAVNEELDRIDEAGTFRSDDEVGFFYQAMYSTLKRLSEYGIRSSPDEPLIGEEYGEKTDILYERDRELHRRLQRVRRPDIEIEDIQQAHRKATEQASGEHNKPI